MEYRKRPCGSVAHIDDGWMVLSQDDDETCCVVAIVETESVADMLIRALSQRTYFLVAQQGGASDEWYVYGFDTRKQANQYRRTANRAYDTTRAFEAPLPANDEAERQLITAINDMCVQVSRISLGRDE